MGTNGTSSLPCEAMAHSQQVGKRPNTFPEEQTALEIIALQDSWLTGVGMVTFGSEPWFEPEPSRT